MQEQPVVKMEQPDPEVFRRVWERVMEGREDSPIQVEPPAEGGGGAGGEPAPQVRPETEPERPADLAGELAELLELAREGLESARQLARRAGGSGGGALFQLAADHRGALRRLGTAYFLETGARYVWRGGAPSPGRREPLDRALREQYRWEEAWARTCRAAAEGLEEADLAELLEELARQAGLHARTIRRLLERL